MPEVSARSISKLFGSTRSRPVQIGKRKIGTLKTSKAWSKSPSTLRPAATVYRA